MSRMTGKTASRGQVAKMAVVTEGDEPMDLLDAGTARSMLKAAAGRVRRADDADEMPDFAENLEGKLVIREESEDRELKWADGRKKKRRAADLDAASDDSDFDDIRHISGAAAAMRRGGGSVAGKTGRSTAPGGSAAGRSRAAGSTVGGRTVGGRTAGGLSYKSVGRANSQHSGDR